tara:strand:- start:3500 stop:4045 length:546 start_codon:yes stop_codon:yes gene_type:complete
MSESTFPEYLDKPFEVRDVRDNPVSAMEPVTPWSADIFNFFASRLMATQSGIGARFGTHLELESGHGVTGYPETFRDNMQARVRFECGYIAATSSTTELTVLFSHTTNGGSVQRFSPTSSLGGEVRIFVTIIGRAGTHTPSWVDKDDILKDSSGDPYGFVITSDTSLNAGGFEWFAIQGWG